MIMIPASSVSVFSLSFFMAALIGVPLLAVVSRPQIKRLLVASGVAGLLAVAVALSIIIPNCCPTWCLLEPICWLW